MQANAATIRVCLPDGSDMQTITTDLDQVGVSAKVAPLSQVSIADLAWGDRVQINRKTYIVRGIELLSA